MQLPLHKPHGCPDCSYKARWTQRHQGPQCSEKHLTPSGTSIQQEDPKPAADPNRVRSTRAHRGSQHNKKETDLLSQNCLGWNGPSNLQQFGVEETFNPKTVWGGRDLQSHKHLRWKGLCRPYSPKPCHGQGHLLQPTVPWDHMGWKRP